MNEPFVPKREPDLYYGTSGFWWEERLISDYLSTAYHFNIDNWTYYSKCRKEWSHINLDQKDKDIVEAFYARWLLEKEILK